MHSAMNGYAHTKNRLQDLKNASNQLKQAVLNDQQPDYNYVRQLFNKVDLSHLSPKLEAPVSIIARSNLSTSKLTLLPFNSSNSDNIGLESERSTKPKPTSRYLLVMDNKKSQQQRQKQLEEEEEFLQKHLTKLKNEVDDLTERSRQQKEDEWKEGIPYQVKQGTLCSFLTRLDIKEKDYNRIDYEKHEISLDGTHITIHQHSKHKQSFLLTDLKEVRYINELILLLEFSHDKQRFWRLFLQFEDEDMLQEWDQGIFVNFRIASELDKSALQSSRLLQSGSISSSRRLEQSVNFDKQSQESHSLSRSKDTTPHHTFMQSSIASLESNKVKQLNVFNQPLRYSQEKEERTDTSKFMKIQSTDPKEQFWGHLDEEPREEAKGKVAVQEQEQDQYGKAKTNLANGYYFTKYSKDGFRPHVKKVYLLPREEKLVWANHDNPSDKKEIKLNQIVSILDKTVGEGVRKHVKRPISEQYCLISYQNEQGISKTLEFGCETHKYMRHFVHNMLLLKGHDAGAVYVGISGRIC